MLVHSAFYKFVKLEDAEAVAVQLRALTGQLHGSVLVAEEGVNGMVAGESAMVDAFERALMTDTRFADIHFKRSACKTPPFRRMKVHVKPEIVPLGIEGIEVTPAAETSVTPQQWRELIRQENTVVLDNRNSFEYRLGRFKNAVDPNVANFRDFPNYVKAHADEWRADGKRVAMYCTGGIRCEKTVAWMRDMQVPVYQLEGGILNYFAEMPDAERDWQGECFVFDNRIALNTHLEETATTLEDVYAAEPDGAWRIARAKRLDEAE